MDTFDEACARVRPDKVFFEDKEMIPTSKGEKVCDSDPCIWWVVLKIPVCKNWLIHSCPFKNCKFTHMKRPYTMIKMLNTKRVLSMIRKKVRKESELAMKNGDKEFKNPFTGKMQEVFPEEYDEMRKFEWTCRAKLMKRFKKVVVELQKKEIRRKNGLCMQELIKVVEERRKRQYYDEHSDFALIRKRITQSLTEVIYRKLTDIQYHKYRMDMDVYKAILILQQADLILSIDRHYRTEYEEKLRRQNQIRQYLDEYLSMNCINCHCVTHKEIDPIDPGSYEAMLKLEEIRHEITKERRNMTWAEQQEEEEEHRKEDRKNEENHGEWKTVSYRNRRRRRRSSRSLK